MCVLLLGNNRPVLRLEDNRPDRYVLWHYRYLEPRVQVMIIVTPDGVAMKKFVIELEQERE
jgi:hypothetical protein